MPRETFLEMAAREFRALKRQADRALAQLPDDEFFSKLDEEGNSPALLVKHLAGNLQSRWTHFLTSDGEKPERDRDGEFEIRAGDSRVSLEAAWEEGWRVLLDALAPLKESDLERTVRIREEEFTLPQAITRSLTHYASHIGQLVLLSRHFAGSSWKSLSIPRGQSRQFNEKPANYLGRRGR